MQTTMIVLRVVHIATAVFWAGTLMFVASFLEPVVRTAGPAAAPVMQGLAQRGYFTKLPIIALIAILSGFALLAIDMRAGGAVFARSPQGMSLSIGGLVAVIAFLIGVFVMRPATLRMGALGAEAAKAPEGPAREALMATMATLRERIKLSVRWTAALLGISVVAMAVARYLG